MLFKPEADQTRGTATGGPGRRDDSRALSEVAGSRKFGGAWNHGPVGSGAAHEKAAAAHVAAAKEHEAAATLGTISTAYDKSTAARSASQAAGSNSTNAYNAQKQARQAIVSRQKGDGPGRLAAHAAAATAHKAAAAQHLKAAKAAK